MRDAAGREPGRDGEQDDEPELSAVDRWLMPYLEDSALWPVTLVVVAHVIAFTAVAVLYAVRQRHPAALVALIGLGWLSFGALRYEIAKRGRPGAIGFVIAGIWALSCGAAYWGSRAGLI